MRWVGLRVVSLFFMSLHSGCLGELEPGEPYSNAALAGVYSSGDTCEKGCGASFQQRVGLRDDNYTVEYRGFAYGWAAVGAKSFAQAGLEDHLSSQRRECREAGDLDPRNRRRCGLVEAGPVQVFGFSMLGIGYREYYQNFYCLCSQNVNDDDPWELRYHAD